MKIIKLLQPSKITQYETPQFNKKLAKNVSINILIFSERHTEV